MPTPDITLYYAPMTRAIRPRWVMEEMGIPYTLERPEFVHGRVGGEAYKAVNPLQKIPAMRDGDTLMLESLAMMQYLTGRYGPTDLVVTPDEPDYARYLEWLHFGEASMVMANSLMLAHTMLLPEDKRNPALARWAKAEFDKQAKLIAERGLDGREWLAGDRLTLADMSVVYMLLLVKLAKQFNDVPDGLKAYFKRVTALDSWKRASAD
ncbi:glutathione S-transferase family protein [Hyphobacterium sp.]|jgi:glutathione S-transferase|uniref:glutathione S-transferase family protein n=1 Tax=Hyphobacterium sp. TaxID=2004662 RepID=UPI003BA8BA1E